MRRYNCKEVTKLVLERHERNLSWRERLGVRFHFLFCGACARFAQHMHFLRLAARRLTDWHGDARETLAPVTKERIRHALRTHQDAGH